MTPELKKYMSEQGKKSWKARTAGMTKKQRSEKMKELAKKRWNSCAKVPLT